jgi:hypothetical protein
VVFQEEAEAEEEVLAVSVVADPAVVEQAAAGKEWLRAQGARCRTQDIECYRSLPEI